MTGDFGAVTLAARAGVARDRAFLVTSALLFVASAAGTTYWCGSMSGGMPMPGGWTMSMAWMRMPGQTWLGAAASFLGMWVVMMVAMMLPSLVAMLLSYRRAVRAGSDATRLGGLTALVGAGYFFVWAVFGLVAYPLGAVLAAAEMRSSAVARSVPIATGVVLLLAGCLQLTSWKSRQLRCCRDAPGCGAVLPPDRRTAWAHGLRLGRHCALCCSAFMMVLLVTDVMDLGAMGMVATAITVERLAPRPETAARASGVIIVAAGALMVTRALWGFHF